MLKSYFVILVTLCSFNSFSATEVRAQKFEKNKQVGKSETAAYNAPWPKGRGFRVGETVPDIPLYDMKGKEVRFSKFLGKRYIFYCWASW